MNSKYTRLDLHKVTDEEGTATEKKTIIGWVFKCHLNKTVIKYSFDFVNII